MAKFESKGQRHTLAAKFDGSSSVPSSLKTTSPRNLPPIGVFWDIENCQVPKGKSALSVAQFIRKKFFGSHREAEFMCVCDINKENKEVIQELNNAQVTVVHINATCKNAADDKLRQSMRRFADIHGFPATIILISGDVNFAADLSDLNHRRHLNIIVLHNNCAPEPLLACAHKHYVFASLLAEIPVRTPVKSAMQSSELLVGNLPLDQNPGEIRKRLKQLSDNCGGRVVSITPGRDRMRAIVRFPTIEAATRAKKRMDREDVFGNKISVNFSSRSEVGEMEKIGTRSVKRYLHGQDNVDRASPNTLSNGFKNYGSPTKKGFPPAPTDFVIPVWASVPVKSKLNSGFDDMGLVKPIASCTVLRPSSEDSHSKCSSSASTGSSLGSRELPLTPPSELEKKYMLQERNSPLHRRSKRRHSCLPYCLSQDRTVNSHPSFRHFTPLPQFNKSSHWANGDATCDQNGLRCSAPVAMEVNVDSGIRISDERDSFFQPIVMNRDDHREMSQSHQPVELLVSNLDQTLESLELKEILLNAFRQHVMVLQILVINNPESNRVAVVKVPSMQDAQYAISQLHRRKIGYKRVVISLASASSCNSPSLPILKSEVIKLLKDVPGGTLPVFKFRELFEKRYHQSISSGELNRMRDVVLVQDTSAGRMVKLNAESRKTPSPATSESSKEVQAIMEVSFCEMHCMNRNVGKGWAEKESLKTLPLVQFSLKILTIQVHKLLETHNGVLPLGSFPVCYELEFGSLAVNEGGIPLEHLIAAVPGVQITQNIVGGKRIRWSENLGPPEVRSLSPPLAAQLALFSREVVDLLKNHSKCLILFNKFIPAYHHHFGRQCRVADYGFTKLIELFEAIPHIVQVMGEGNKRLLTLTHRVQMKRFSADLLRVLKSQASKQVVLNELPILYTKCLGKEFDITNYGICEVMDMLSSLAENTITVTTNGSETIIAIPKREQTSEEVERTKHFAEEVVELLRHSPRCQMSFNKFIPAYHHHFGRQCRVSDYGFTKLIELLEAIPHVISITEADEEKMLVLCEKEQLKVLADQVVLLVQSSPGSALPLHSFVSSFTQFYGHSLSLVDFQADSIPDLLKNIESIKVISSNTGPLITLVENNLLRHSDRNIQHILNEQSGSSLLWNNFKMQSNEFEECNLLVTNECPSIVQVDKLGGSLQLFACNLRSLLKEYNGHLLLHKFEGAYEQHFNCSCRPEIYGFSSILSLLLAMPDVIHVRGKGNKRMVVLNKIPGSLLCDFSPRSKVCQHGSKGLSSQVRRCSSSVDYDGSEDDELLQMYSPIDLLSAPVPSCIPSPSLQPSLLVPMDDDLMRFDSPVLSDIGDVTSGSSESKSLPAQDPMVAASTLLQSLVLSSPPPNAHGAKAGVSAAEMITSWMTPGLTSQITSTPNRTSFHSECDLLHPDGVTVQDSKMLVQSCDDLTCTAEAPTVETMAVSSQSTPTHQVLKHLASRQRSRLAAHFSNLPSLNS